MTELWTFFMGLMAVGIGFTAKVARDGLSEIRDLKLLIENCLAERVTCEGKPATAEEEVGRLEPQVAKLRDEVKELEAKEKEVSSTVKVKREAESEKSRTSFKVNLG